MFGVKTPKKPTPRSGARPHRFASPRPLSPARTNSARQDGSPPALCDTHPRLATGASSLPGHHFGHLEQDRSSWRNDITRGPIRPVGRSHEALSLELVFQRSELVIELVFVALSTKPSESPLELRL